MKLNYKKKQTRRVTIKDLADDLGLSVGAVSQALNPRTNINIKLKPETIARVRAYANQLNYRPHAGASSIRSKHFGNVGYMVAKKQVDVLEPAAEVQAGIHDAALEHNFRVTLIRVPSTEARNSEAVSRVFHESHLDSLIILDYEGFSPAYERVLSDTDFPIIFLNHKIAHQAIFVDDVAGMSELTAHLIAQGHRNIAYFSAKKPKSGEMIHYSVADRYEGYKRTMQAAKLEASAPWNLEEKGEEATQNWLYGDDRPDAIVCYSDADATEICKRLYQQGVRIPDQIAVVGYGDNAAAQFSWVPLTTMSIPYYQMAYLAFQQALGQMNPTGEPQPFDSISVQPRLCVRASSMRVNQMAFR
jgi:DNA-binding LacI/PurR family transcriptional regulator